MEKAREVWLAVLAALICVLSTGPAGLAAPIGTSFTYQGRLYDGGTPAAGPHDFTFELYDDAAAGTQRHDDPPRRRRTCRWILHRVA